MGNLNKHNQDYRVILQHLLPALISDSQPSNYTANTSGSNPEMLNREYLTKKLKLIFSYRWLILTVSAIVIGFTFIQNTLQTPMYKSYAVLNVGIYNPAYSRSSSDNPLTEETRNYEYLDTQVKLLKSLPLADRVLSIPEVHQALSEYFSSYSEASGTTKPTGRYQKYRHTLPKLKQYLSLIKVNPIKKTSLIEVKVVTNDPEFSSLIANAHAETFIEHTRIQRQTAAVENLSLLKGQADELAAKVTESERNLGKYAEEHAIITLNKDENIVAKKMAELSDLLTQATARRIQYESASKQANETNEVPLESLGTLGILKSNQQLEDAEAKYFELLEKYTENYPLVKQLKGRIEKMRNMKLDRKQEVIKALEGQFKTEAQVEKTLIFELEKQKNLAFELAQKQVQYNILKREYESSKDLYQTVIQQLKESQVELDAMGTNIRVVEFAAPSLSPVGGNYQFALILALLLGPALGIGLVFLLELMDNTYREIEDLETSIRLPILGSLSTAAWGKDNKDSDKSKAFAYLESVKESSGEEVKVEENPEPTEEKNTLDESFVDSVVFGLQQLKHVFKDIKYAELASLAKLSPHSRLRWMEDIPPRSLVAASEPNSKLSEEFRSLASALAISSADKPANPVLVTSATQNDGKSFIAANLAVTLTQFSDKVAVINCDLRASSSIETYFGIPKKLPGLVEYLTGQALLDQVLLKTPVENLDIICAGKLPPNPIELFRSDKMKHLLASLKKEYEYVIVDSVPVLQFADVSILAQQMEGALFVARANKTPRPYIKKALASLETVHAKILGCIFNAYDNKWSSKLDSYYYYNQQESKEEIAQQEENFEHLELF